MIGQTVSHYRIRSPLLLVEARQEFQRRSS
jgi:hypothetical protein